MNGIERDQNGEPRHTQHHRDRIALIRRVQYETMVSDPLNVETASSCIQGEALSLNISSKGMLVLMDRVPRRDEVVRLMVPSPIGSVNTPTLADVRWTSPLPLVKETAQPLYFVGLRFIL